MDGTRRDPFPGRGPLGGCLHGHGAQDNARVAGAGEEGNGRGQQTRGVTGVEGREILVNLACGGGGARL